MYRYGTISEIDSDKARVRVDFEEDDIVSPWLAVLMPKTKDDKYFHIPDIGEMVAVLMDEYGESGVVVGAIYTNDNTPSLKGDDITAVKFKDGTEVEYDRANSKMRLKIVGDLTIVCDKDVNVECKNATVKATTKTTIDSPTAEFTGNVKVTGSVEANGDVKAAANTVPISLLTHKHPTPAGPSSTPIP